MRLSILPLLLPSLLIGCVDTGSGTSPSGKAEAAGVDASNGLCTPPELLYRLQATTREARAEFEASTDCAVLRSARFSVPAESDDPREAALVFLEAWSELLPLGASPAKHLSVYRVVQDDNIDGWHVFLQVAEEGVVVEQSTLRVDLAGDAVVGLDLSARLQLPPSATPRVTAAAVPLLARDALRASDGLDWQVSPLPRLFFRNPEGGVPRLVWGMQATVLTDGMVEAEGEVILDAETGALVELRAPPITDASPDIDILDGGGISGPCFWSFWGNSICDESGCDSGAGSVATGLRTEMRAWHTARRAWDGKDGWDGSNGQMEAVIYIDDYDNASYVSWCDQTRYGSGWTVRDVVGHEQQHAVDEHTAELKYEGQSGALDEHLADLQGEAFEYVQTGKADWVVGVGLSGSRSGGIRSFIDPSTFRHPFHMSRYLTCTDQSCGTDDDEWDSIEVHTNSSIPNHVLYLVSEGGEHLSGSPTIKGIGIDETIALTRWVHQGWLHEGSNFGAYRGALINALVQQERTQGKSTAAGRCALMNAWAGAGIHSFDQDCDGIIDAQDTDLDGDGFTNDVDVCPSVPDPAQGDLDFDGLGDSCDDDLDGDGLKNEKDTCPTAADASNRDSDRNGIGDACQDRDGDGVLDINDICPAVADPDQADLDRDRIGDACDDDIDNDRVRNEKDNCPRNYSHDQADSDGDGLGDICEDDDQDGIINQDDVCPLSFDPLQEDLDRDRLGDACDDDLDNDGLKNEKDDCPRDPSESYGKPHLDTDGDGTGDACDACPEDAGLGLYQPCLADQDGDGAPDLWLEWSWEDVSLPLDMTAVMTLSDVLLYPHPTGLPGLIPLPACTGGSCPDWREDSELLSIQTAAGVDHLAMVLDHRGQVVARRQAEKTDDGYTLSLSFAPGSDARPATGTIGALEGQHFLLVLPSPDDLDTHRAGAQALYTLSIK